MNRRLAAITGGASATPLLLLFAFNLVDEFDRVAFGVLAPEIRDTFGLSDSGVAAVASVVGVTAIAAALPIGVLADRVRRVRVAGIGAAAWGGFTVLAALSPATWVLVLARMGGGVGRIVNEPVHASLLTDYYRPEQHPKVFAVHRAANPLGLTSALLIGFLGTLFDWRFVFLLLAIPTFLLLPTLLRLREPRRGESLDATLAAKAEGGRVSFGEARRQLFAVRTLKRLWVAMPVLGIAVVALPVLITLFFERVYGFDSFGRGVVTFLSGAGTFAGLLLGQRLATKALVAGRPEQLALYDGLAIAGIGGGLALAVLAPWSALSAACVFLLGVAVGAYQPAYFSLVGIVSPAKVRSQAYAYTILYLGGGALLSPLFADLGESSGYRTSLGLLAATLVAGGLVVTTARGSVRRDAEQAAAALATAAELDEQARDGADQPLLTVRGLDVAYDGVQVLFGVDVEVRRGEILALLGTNGAGKSTLLNAVSGLTDPVGGSIYFDGRDITHADAVQTAGLGIVQVPGGKSSFPTLSVAEHFRLAGWLHGDDPQRLAAATEEVLDRFPRLRERWDTAAGALSGGEQQQLALGMAFVARPRLLLIDELSLGLSPVVVSTLLEMVRAIHAQGTTVVVVEQSVNVALSLAERAYFLEKGQVRFSGPTADLLGRDDVLRSVFLAGAAATATVAAPPPEHDVDASSAPAVECSGLSVRFGGVTAVDDVDLEVRPGEVVGLLGANGAGKTTLFDLLSGYLVPSSGTVRLAGRDVTGWSPDRRALAGLGRSFQDARIFGSLTVAENLAVSLERHLELRSYVASGLFLPDANKVEDDVAYSVEDLVELLGLGALRDKQVRELSTGSRRIVDLGMALAHDPAVMLLDEPSSGIAQRETEALGPLLLKLRDDTGCALLVIEHDMPLLSSVCDRLVALEQGRVIAQGAPQDVLQDERVLSSYLGGDPTAVQRSGAVAVTT